MDNAVNTVATPPPSGGEVAGVMIFSIFVWVFLLFMYFLPTVIAAIRKHRQLGPIAAINVLLGWTVLGWIGAFIWSLMTPQQPPQTIIVQAAAAPAPPTPPQPPSA